MILNEEVIQQVWEKARITQNNDPKFWRKDSCNAWIKRVEYGNRESQYGWEIDYIDVDKPPSIENFQPLHWKNHVEKKHSQIVCHIASKGVENTEIDE
ncbi:MAG: HNH endonuclease [Candidatus Woesearchaeota archaeon]